MQRLHLDLNAYVSWLYKAVLMTLNLQGRAAVDTDGVGVEATVMDARIDILEREVGAIKSEIAVIKSMYWTREDAREMDARLIRVETAITILQADVAQLKIDVAQLKADVAQLRAEVADLKVDIAKIRSEIVQMEARLKSWMINLAITLVGVISGIQFALYSALTR